MSQRRPYLIIAALSAGVAFACGSTKQDGGVSNNGAGGTSTGGTVGTSTAGVGGVGVAGSLATNGGTAGAGGTSVVQNQSGSGGTAGQNTGGANNVAGSGGTPNVGGAAGAAGAGVAGTAGTAGSGGASNPGNYAPPPRDIMITSTDLVSMTNNGSTASFDASKTVQKKLFVPMGGVNSGPMVFGWAVQRGYHMIAVPVANGYPDDQYHREYLEAWSGENLGAGITQPPEDSVMGRVKSTLVFMAANDPGGDWGYYLDAAGEVRWNDVIVFGYSFGGQMGVAATKYVALDRVVITASPNIPIDSPWLTDMPNITPPERCYQFVGYQEGEHQTHINETALLGWLGDPFDVGDGVIDPPPYPSNRLTVDDGHSQFCGRPFNDGMKDWDAICEWLFNTQK